MSNRCYSCGAPQRTTEPACAYCGTLYHARLEIPRSAFRPGEVVALPALPAYIGRMPGPDTEQAALWLQEDLRQRGLENTFAGMLAQLAQVGQVFFR